VYVDTDRPGEAVKHLLWTESGGIPSDVLIEIDAMSRFSHPNVNCARSVVLDVDAKRVAIYQTRATQGTLKQLISAPSDDKLSRWRRSPTHCLRMWLQLLRGVHELHRQRFMHGDIKPVNILVTEGQVLRVADLGLVQLVSGRLVRPLGLTVRYAAWEVLRASQSQQQNHNDAHEEKRLPIGLASDVFSLACVFFEMLSADATPLLATGNAREWFAFFYGWHSIDPVAERVLQRRRVREYLDGRLGAASASSDEWDGDAPSTITRDASDLARLDNNHGFDDVPWSLSSSSSSSLSSSITRLMGHSRQVGSSSFSPQFMPTDDGPTRPKPLHKSLFGSFQPKQREQILDLLTSMLDYDPCSRPSIETILAHPLFSRTNVSSLSSADERDGCCFRRKPLVDVCAVVKRHLLTSDSLLAARQELVERLIERTCVLGAQTRVFFVAVMLVDRTLACEFQTKKKSISVELLALACLRLACKFFNQRWLAGPFKAMSPEHHVELAHIELEILRRVDGDMLPHDFWFAAHDVYGMQRLFAATAHHPDWLWTRLVAGNDDAAYARFDRYFVQPAITRTHLSSCNLSIDQTDARVLSLNDLLTKQTRVYMKLKK